MKELNYLDFGRREFLPKEPFLRQDVAGVALEAGLSNGGSNL